MSFPSQLPALVQQHASLCMDAPWHQGILTLFSSNYRNNIKNKHFSEVGWHRAVWAAEHQHFNVPQCSYEKCVFCILRCCWRWLPKRSSIMGLVLSMNALRPAAKGCLISPNFTWRQVPSSLLYCWASVRPGLQFPTICCILYQISILSGRLWRRRSTHLFVYSSRINKLICFLVGLPKV